MRVQSLSRLSLDKAFLGFMALGAFVFFAVTMVFVNNRVERLEDDILRAVVEVRGTHLALDIVNHIENHWVDLENLATVLPFSDRVTFRSFLTREVSAGDHLVWAAYVTVQGDVSLASRQQREQENVAQEDWFIRAQSGPMVRYSKDDAGDDRLIMTFPVRATASIGEGYLTFHFRPDWFETKLADLARSLLIDYVVFDGRGMDVLHSFDYDPADAQQISTRNAMAGQTSITLETWGGLGLRYAVSVPELPPSALPEVGWQMVVLAPQEQFVEATSQLRLALVAILGGVALVLLAMSFGFIRIFLVPMHRLVMNAHDIAAGVDVVPMEHHRTAELSILSSALVRIQGRMLRAEDKLAEVEALHKDGANGGPN